MFALSQEPFKYKRRVDSPGPPALPIPARIHECESFCGDWTFDGTNGTANWQNGSTAVLTVERYDSEGITIRRDDQGGATAGLQAIYTGKLHGNQIEGEIAWLLPEQLKGAHGMWKATIEKSASPPAAKPKNGSPPAPQASGDYDFNFTSRSDARNSTTPTSKTGITSSGLSEGLDSGMFRTWPANDPPAVLQTSGQEAWKKARVLEADEKFSEALFWYERAVVKHYKSGAADIGFFYRHGLGVPFSDSMAAKWYEFGVAQNDTVAMQRLAQLRMNGWGVPKDTNSAATLIGSSYRLSYDSDAAYGLAMTYRFGVPGVVIANQGQSAFWLRSAADALRMSDHSAQNGQGPGLCAEEEVEKKMAASLGEMLKRLYTDPKSFHVVVLLKETDFPLPEAPAILARQGKVVTALVRHSDDEAECYANFDTEPRNWVFRVNRLELPPEKKRLDLKPQFEYLVIPASGSQWFKLQLLQAEMMGNGIPVPMSIQNLHDFDQPH